MIRRAALAAWLLASVAASVAALADPARALQHAGPAGAGAAHTAPLVVLRTGEHPGFTRLVFHLPPGSQARVQARPGGMVVQVPGATFAAGAGRALPEVTLSGDRAVLAWAPGTQTRQMHLPGRLVIDLLHPALSAAPPPSAEPAPASRRAAAAMASPLPPTVARSAPPPPAPAMAAAPPAMAAPLHPAEPVTAPTPAPMPTPVPPTVTASAPPPAAPAPTADSAAAPTLPVAASPLAVPAGPDTAAPSGPTLRFTPGTGAAAFRHGPWAIAVFDEPRPLDLAAVHAVPGLSTAQVQSFAAVSEIRVRLGADQALAVMQRRGGWAVAVVDSIPGLRAIRPVATAGHLQLDMDRPGRVVSVPDPDTGGLLLVGTQRPMTASAWRAAQAAASVPGAAPVSDAQGVPVERHTPLFALLASWRGVAVEPGADDLMLRSSPSGFVLERTATGQALSMAEADGADRVDAAATFSRLFDLPDASLQQLSRRLKAAAGLASMQPVQGRGLARLHAAQAMLALGLGAEAAGLVGLAETDDARLAEDPQAQALAAAAALLAGRTAEAARLDDPALTAPGAPGTDEMMLWRALLAAARADTTQQADPAAAQILAAKLPLLQSYPAPLRDRLLPLALRTMVLGGEPEAAQRAVDAQPLDHRLDYVRALLAEHDGHMPEALALADRLTQSRDRDMAARAAVRAVQIRLESHALTPEQAADALDPLIYAWRGDSRELAVRLREASLRREAGQPRAAIALLRDAADPVLSQGWPERRPAIAAMLRDTFAEAVSRDAGQPMSALDFVAMVQENADLIPGGNAGQMLAERVADRLASLDLPDQAAAALSKLMTQLPPGGARGTLGARLAALQLEQHDSAAALTTLSASTSAGMAPGLVETRTLLFARASAARGHLDAATGALEALGTPAADDLEATLLTDAGKWPQATAALQRVVRRQLPPTGMLDEAQSGLLLRLASAAAQANDAATLAAVRDEELARVPPGKSADLLRVLTEGPVQTVADLPRAGTEMALARSALK